MAPNSFQLKYDEMALIAKKFRDQGEDIGKLHSVTRARVRDMRKEWIGEAAEKFFAEMENEALPALERLSRALFVTQDVTLNISKIIRSADEETATFFRDRISGDDFGAGKFGDALQGLQGMRPGADDFGASQFGAALGGASGGGGGGADDFGASQFGAALDGASGGSGGGADDFGASKFEEAGAPGSSQAPQAQEGGGGQDRDGGGSGDEKKPETEPSTAGGGGGGGGESQGLKGDLKNMGAGLSDQAAQSGAMGASGGGGAMEDTIYSGGGSGGGGGQPQPGAAGTGGGGGGGESAPDAGSAAAAGAAGVVGTAAAGGAAKVIKEQKFNDTK